MQERLSIKKVFKNAVRYVIRHLFAFLFLTIFYFLGSLLPMLIGLSSFKVATLLVMFFYSYIFFYFAAGCYYKQQILLDRQAFFAASLRFLTAILLFLASILLSSFMINLVLSFIKSSFMGGEAIIFLILHSLQWLIGKYLFIFLLFIIFFIIPSFAFISEITGKSRSILAAYAKTKGNVIKIAIVAAFCFALLLLTMGIFAWANPFVATLARAIILVFITIVYFKVYDFFYKLPQNKKTNQPLELIEEKPQKVMLAGLFKFALPQSVGHHKQTKDTKDVNQG